MPALSFELIETMAYLPTVGLRNEAAHLSRLTASAAFFGFQVAPEDVRAQLRRAVATESDPKRVRLALRRTGAVAITLQPAPGPPTRPVRLAVDSQPVSSHSVWLAHKTTQREPYDSRAARHPNADDVLLVNEHGQVTESTIANLAVRLGRAWFTPPVEAGCLPGVERARLVAAGRLSERLLDLRDLLSNDGLALVSSLRGWRRACLVRSDTDPRHPVD